MFYYKIETIVTLRKRREKGGANLGVRVIRELANRNCEAGRYLSLDCISSSAVFKNVFRKFLDWIELKQRDERDEHAVSTPLAA